MPSGPSSAASARVSAASPPLAAVYAASPARAMGPAMDVMLTMRPPGCGISGSAARHSSNGATRCDSSRVRSAGASSSVKGRRSRRPALFTSTSSRPLTRATVPSAARRAVPSVTSQGRARTWAPGAATACTCATAVASVCGSRPFSHTLAPCAASPWAMANPSPREAPVTSAVRPLRSNKAWGVPGVISLCPRPPCKGPRGIGQNGLSATCL